MKMNTIHVIGGGLAGCEACWQIAKRGVPVNLYEMKPDKYTPAHSLSTFAELVCSNSLRSDRLENGVGLLKEEMRMLDSLIMRMADKTRIPAGGALAVDRVNFSAEITDAIKSLDNVSIINKEVHSLDGFSEDDIVVIATGPLTSESLSKSIGELVGKDYLYFYDAAAPIVTLDSIDMTKAFRASRYGRGTDDYINCPMDQDEYENFYNAIINAEVVPIKSFEEEKHFEGCMPIEAMAKRGKDTMRFGPMKPVGLTNPHTGEEAYAVVQLRQDNAEGTLFNIVGFQTHLKFPEQKRVFGRIPGLENAEFVRYGVMHRNTFINSPGNVEASYRLIKNNNVFFAGQITGVEGYVESTSSGLVAGINAARAAAGKEMCIFPENTAIGGLASYISTPVNNSFQPMNATFGIIKHDIRKPRDKKARYLKIAEESLATLKDYILTTGL
jgi:methylenetetrahydrofolate--tRNA-(uracil-5-)-methyltransferase